MSRQKESEFAPEVIVGLSELYRIQAQGLTMIESINKLSSHHTSIYGGTWTSETMKEGAWLAPGIPCY
jgi:hypothetical protein